MRELLSVSGLTKFCLKVNSPIQLQLIILEVNRQYKPNFEDIIHKIQSYVLTPKSAPTDAGPTRAYVGECPTR